MSFALISCLSLVRDKNKTNSKCEKLTCIHVDNMGNYIRNGSVRIFIVIDSLWSSKQHKNNDNKQIFELGVRPSMPTRWIVHFHATWHPHKNLNTERLVWNTFQNDQHSYGRIYLLNNGSWAWSGATYNSQTPRCWRTSSGALTAAFKHGFHGVEVNATRFGSDFFFSTTAYSNVH